MAAPPIQFNEALNVRDNKSGGCVFFLLTMPEACGNDPCQWNLWDCRISLLRTLAILQVVNDSLQPKFVVDEIFYLASAFLQCECTRGPLTPASRAALILLCIELDWRRIVFVVIESFPINICLGSAMVKIFRIRLFPPNPWYFDLTQKFLVRSNFTAPTARCPRGIHQAWFYHHAER